jgi:hypothetical protein
MPSHLLRSQLRQSIIRKDVALRREMTQAMSDTGALMKQFHELVVRDWDHRPSFVIGYNVTPDRIFVRVYPRGANAKLWRYVDEGTKPHDIYPRARGGRLKFQTGYSPRTAATAKFNVGTGSSIGGWASKKTGEPVHHPGTEAREFTKTIQDEMKPLFERLIENAFRRALRR